MSERDTEKDRPAHSVEKPSGEARERPGGHEVEPPEERPDDEARDDQAKTTTRQE